MQTCEVLAPGVWYLKFSETIVPIIFSSFFENFNFVSLKKSIECLFFSSNCQNKHYIPIKLLTMTWIFFSHSSSLKKTTIRITALRTFFLRKMTRNKTKDNIWRKSKIIFSEKFGVTQHITIIFFYHKSHQLSCTYYQVCFVKKIALP